MDKWYNYEVKDIISKLKSRKEGLSSEEVIKRLSYYGENIIPKSKKTTLLKVFLSQLNDPIIYVLIVTTIFSFLVNEILDACFIVFVILLDAFLGTIQEWKSHKNAQALVDLIKLEVQVIRNGKRIKIDSKELVIGDIVLLETGSKIPADVRFIETHNLSVDESILTGESYSIDKTSNPILKEVPINEQTNIGFLGTSVLRGRATGIVVNTGIRSEIGKIAKQILKTKDTSSPLEIRMKKFSNQIGIITAIISIILSFILYLKGFMMKEIFFSVIALSVSAIPEGLPVSLTLSLSIASSRMAKRNVLVKKLNAVESLGSTTLIASDKTGTLTLNEQTAKVLMFPNGKKVEVTGTGYNNYGKVKELNKTIIELIKVGVLANEGSLEKNIDGKWINVGDSIDVAFLSLGYKANLDIKELKKEIVGLIPYESEEKYSGVFFTEKNKTYCALKGSIEKLLEFATNMKINDKIVPIDKTKLLKLNDELSKNGYRVIALSIGEKNKLDLKNDYNIKDIPKQTIIGMVGFIDPIRKEVKSAIKKCTIAGVKTVMITGDHPLTSEAIAKELGLIKSSLEVTTGKEIDIYLKKGNKEFDEFIKTKKVFSRVNPIQKLRIIESYKRLGEFVAVTGDGVNDTPALKAANVGIAMGSGTDVAKETGDMIITDDNFVSIVSGIEEGRYAYNNIRKVIFLLLSCGLCEVVFYILSIIFNYELPLLAIQLLWINVVTDGLQDASLSFEKGENGVMNKPPRDTKETIFNKLLAKEVILDGLIMGLIVFIFWVYLIDIKELTIIHARTSILLLMVFIQNLHVLNCRSETESFYKLPIKNNYFLFIAIIMTLFIQFVVVENSFLSSILNVITLPIKEVLSIFILATPILIVSEILKYFERKK